MARNKPTGLNRKYLRVQDLRRLQNFFFSSRRTVEGLYSGKHATPQRGKSVEFRDYRQYIPGDDIGSVDWKVYGRSDKLFIKMFEHHADMTVHLLVDGSASMAYRGLAGGMSKYDQACHLAAAIAFLICKQHDRVSFALAQKGLSEALRPAGSMTHLVSILETMERNWMPEGEAKLPDAIKALTATSRRRDLLIVLSDLLDEPEATLKAMSLWLHRGGECIVFHVLHRDEIELPPMSSATFIDSENRNRVRLDIADVRESYQREIQKFLDSWSKSCRGYGIDYNRVLTSEPYHRALEQYLFSRAASV